MAWIVKLIKSPTIYTFRNGYFPRKFHYKKDADELQRMVEDSGGESVVEKETRMKPQATRAVASN